jgi:hypothetical protein
MPHFFIEISDLADNFASPEDDNVRDRIEDAIVNQRIGRITGSGSGLGAMDLSAETPNVDGIKDRLTTLIRSFVPTARFEIREIADPDVREEDRERLRALGGVIGPERCKRPSCGRLRIVRSVFVAGTILSKCGVGYRIAKTQPNKLPKFGILVSQRLYFVRSPHFVPPGN